MLYCLFVVVLSDDERIRKNMLKEENRKKKEKDKQDRENEKKLRNISIDDQDLIRMCRISLHRMLAFRVRIML
jgi:hypothetical protein